MSVILGAQNFCPGISSPNELRLLLPNLSGPVFESPTMHVEFLLRQLMALNVRLYLVPSVIDPLSMQCWKKSCDFLVIWYSERGMHSWTDSFLVCWSMNLMLHCWPRERVNIDDSVWIVTSLSEWSGRWPSDPWYLLTRQELIWGAGLFFKCGYFSWYIRCWSSLTLSTRVVIDRVLEEHLCKI